jgi:plasmid stabilization system protein ParE
LFFSVYQYLIVYRCIDRVEIVAVLHGKRDVRRLLQKRGP